MSAGNSYSVPNIDWPKGTQWVRMPNGWQVALVSVTPALAERMLATNADNQRHQKPRVIDRYAGDMSAGLWALTHQGVAFNTSGHLHDGQNRLAAVVKSGRAIQMFVWLGAGGDPEMSVIDTNAPRTVRDAADVLRLEVDRAHIPTLNAAVRYGVVNGAAVMNQLTHSGRLILLERHERRLADVADWFGSGGMARRLGPGPVRAAVFCAYDHVDRRLLERFFRVYTEQLDPDAGEGIAKRLRALVVGTAPPERELYLKCCRAIRAFVNREDLANLHAPTENPFPWAVETDAEPAAAAKTA